MANYYTLSSTSITIPPDEFPRAKELIVALLNAYEEENGFADISVEFIDKDEIWIHGDESFDIELAVQVIQLVLDNFTLPEPYIILSWAFTCSKPRVDSFSGGACLIQRGKEPQYFDPVVAAQDALKDEIQ
jgi:hypothetical protein